jgi:DNA replication and repair protein RecF
VLVIGPNGAGKTNLLEAVHLGTQGFSPRTRTDAQLVRFGEPAGRIALRGDRGGVPVTVDVVLRPGEGKRAELNGVRLRAAEQLRGELAALVFTPDRLAVVKGGPAARRAYFDRVLGRLSPARAPLPAEYGGALAQRNAALRRAAGGFSQRDVLEPWTQRVAELAAALVEARREAIAALEPRFAERADELGLADGKLLYDSEPPSADELEARLDKDLERGITGIGPHLDDVTIACGDRDLRQFGSQGEQRLAVLSLLLGEADLLGDRGPAPLLLLDDVLSELDPRRREILAARVSSGGQALVTATSRTALPREPDLLLEVAPSPAGSSVRRV